MVKFIKILKIAFLSIVFLFPISIFAQSSEILFRMNNSSSAWPSAGWDRLGSEQYGTRWTAQRVAGAGPQGQDVAQLTELPGTGQHGWGWDGNVIPNWTSNNSRFFRWRQKITGNLDSGSSNKLLIYQQGCSGGNCREIVQVNVLNDMVQYKVQQDGGDYQVESGYIFPLNTWLDVQVEMHSSSNPGANDGYTKMWINNNNYSSPTVQTGPMVFEAGGSTNFASNYVIFGGYNNSENVASGSTNVQQLTDFEIATSFNSNWNISGSPTPTPTPPPPSPTPPPPTPTPTPPTPTPPPPSPGSPVQPTVSGLPTCSYGSYSAGNINWTNPLDQYGGVWVSVSTNINFTTGYSKYVEAYSTTLTQFEDGNGNILSYSPNTTYYARLYNGLTGLARSFSVPLCSPTPTPTPVVGDINLDHVVNSLDWSLMNSNWFGTNAGADLNSDGSVNSLDFALLSSNWLRTW